MRTNTALAALVIATAALLPGSAFAQADSRAQLELRVVDQTNAAVPAATVTIYTLDGKPGQTVKTNEKGVAVFSALPAGMAQIRAEYPGFTPYTQKAALRSGGNAQTVRLTLAPFRETVTVRATPDATAGS
jgi:hypothetical protein